MVTANENCSYTASKADPTTWHGEEWLLDRDSHQGLNQDTWTCPHEQIEGEDHDYCVFHTEPDDVPDHVDEAEQLVKTVNGTEAVDDDEHTRRKKEFIGATFGRMELPAGTLLGTDDDYPIRFTHARFSEGIRVDRVSFGNPVYAEETRFVATNDHIASFGAARFKDDVSFRGAEFSGDGSVSFRGAEFSGDGSVSFKGAEFSGDGSILFIHAGFGSAGDILFDDAKFCGDGDVFFGGTEFSGEGNVSFQGVEFSGEGDVSFRGAEFSGDGDVLFDDTKFRGGPVSFDDAGFSGDGDVSFIRAEFSSDRDVSFDDAGFSGDGDVSFIRAEFSGDGDVSFVRTEFRSDGDMSFWNLDLSGASLRDADFSDVDLRTANLSNADLRGVNLSRCNLQETDLSDTKMDGGTRCGRQAGHPDLLSRLRTAISQTIRHDNQTEKEADWDAMARSYYNLKSRYSEHGLVGKARRHHMLEREARRQEALSSRETIEYTGSWLSWLITGYGVDYRRVVVFMLAVFIPSTIVYLHYGVTSSGSITGSLYYSVVTFTTAPPEWPPSGVPIVVAMIETFIGTLLVVLLGYVLGNRESF